MHPGEPPHPPNGRPRAAALLVLVLVTLALHGLLLGGSEFGGQPDARPAPAVAPVQVRSVVPPTVEVAVPSEPVGAPAAPPLPAAPVQAKAAAAPVLPKVAATAPLQVAATVPTARAEPATTVALATAPDAAAVIRGTALASAAPAETTLVADAKPSPAPPAGDAEIPTYRTRLPPPATLRYTLRRGILSGTGELQWKPAGDGYELRLEGRVAGISILTQTSTGGVDEAGIAPLRFVDQRRRDVRAANFQRDKRLITFSGPALEYPLLPGSQDRLSWMIQLGAIVNAEPQRAAAGGRVAMFIVGARGDGDVWVFRFVADESVATEGGTVNAVKFTREPRRPYDTLVEVWLDPLRHHLPVHARLSTAPDGSTFDLLLRDMQ
jgi:hypothetical protein